MKKLECEMCGSSDLIKMDGLFVCQYCGCKYTLEEARKLMIDGTVDVKGTVQIDHSPNIKSYLENARRAKEKEDWEETEKYYNMVEQYEPNNLEAIFYSAYGKAMSSLIEGDIFKRKSALNVLKKSISIIDDNFDVNKDKENETVILSIAADLGKMISSNFVINVKPGEFVHIFNEDKRETQLMFRTLVEQFKESIENIIRIQDEIYLHEALVLLYSLAVTCGSTINKNCLEWINIEREKIDYLNVLKREKYWLEHAEEKEKLEQEKAKLYDQVRNLNDKILKIKKANNYNTILQEMKELEDQKTNFLLMFKFKQANIISEKIKKTQEEFVVISTKVDNELQPLQNEVKILLDKITNIDKKLNMDR